MTLPHPPEQPQDPQQPQQDGYVPPQPPTDLSQQPQQSAPPGDQYQQQPPPGQYQQPAPPTGQFQQPGPQFAPNGQPGYPPTGQFPQQPQSFQDKLRTMPPKQLGKYAGIGGGGLLVLILILVFAFSGGGPGDTVDDYLSEIADGDLVAAQEYLCDPGDFITEADVEKHQDEIDKAVEGMDWEIVNEHVAGDKATIEVKITGSEEVADEAELELELREGDWFICDGGSSMM